MTRTREENAADLAYEACNCPRQATYKVESFGPDGVYVEPDKREHETLEEARADVVRRFGGLFGRWYPEEDNAVEGWSETAEEDVACGGAVIYRIEPESHEARGDVLTVDLRHRRITQK